MKRLEKFFHNVTNVVAQKWLVFLRNLPLRMAVGRFGIWLMKVGRFLQIRYANWNSEFRLQHEFHPNPDCCTIHVSEPIIDNTILTFESPLWQLDKMTPMVKDLFDVKGISKVTLQRYTVSLMKGKVYRWEELISAIDEIVLKHLTA